MKKLILLLLLACPLEAAQKPNIIFIMVDDMGRDWVSCYGAAHPTPNVDRLAREGVRYETAWGTPICTPTRVTLLTGQYPFRHGWVQHYDVPRWGGAGLRPDRFTTFARVLRDAGYATAIGGKWQINHLGKQPGILKQHGFDEHCVWPGVEEGRPETTERFWDGFLVTNGKRGKVPYGPDAINRFLVDFMKRHKDRPFLLYYPMLLTHGPHTTTPMNREKAPEGKPALYAGNVTYMDHLVGKLVSAVDELGLKERTLIVFTGDNGSASPGSLQGESYPKGKGREADWGVHVPFIVRAPSLVPQAGLATRDLVDFTDIYPTFVELSGATLPAGVPLDGKSLVPSISGDDDPFKKRNWIYSQIGTFRMVRDWQYLLDNREGFYQLSDGRNAVTDLLQTKNLFTSQERVIPGRRARLQKILDRFPPNAGPPFDGFEPARD